jgi:hypothetical protein
MKTSEAVRIQSLLAARRPPVTYEETAIEGVRMIVIVGNEVDTVIRFSRGGSADMPQISSYPDKAEAAAYADQRLAKQRASGRAIDFELWNRDRAISPPPLDFHSLVNFDRLVCHATRSTQPNTQGRSDIKNSGKVVTK